MSEIKRKRIRKKGKEEATTTMTIKYGKDSNYRYKGESRQKKESRLNLAGRLSRTMRGEMGMEGGAADQERRPELGVQCSQKALIYRNQAGEGDVKPSPLEGGV